MAGKLTSEFTEEYEIFVFQQAFEAVGHTVDVICPDKKAGQSIATSLHDFEGHQTSPRNPATILRSTSPSTRLFLTNTTPSIALVVVDLSISPPTNVYRQWFATFTKKKADFHHLSRRADIDGRGRGADW
jgi:hypothetical protein